MGLSSQCSRLTALILDSNVVYNNPSPKLLLNKRTIGNLNKNLVSGMNANAIGVCSYVTWQPSECSVPSDSKAECCA